MADVKYVDPDNPWEDGETQGRKPPKKLYGSTQLQKDALIATGRRSIGFTNNVQLKAFQEVEALAEGADAESRMWAAWMKYRITETSRLNTGGGIKVNMDELIRRMKSESDSLKRTREIWFMDNRERILNKKTPEEIANQLGINNPGVSEMERAMEKRKKNAGN